ncbi:MAG: hypothetical protein LBE64_21120 [Acinetobacter pittii]|jgi:hypothetical protein|nr:hypothetical protein [Acinetobacter pittii]
MAEVDISGYLLLNEGLCPGGAEEASSGMKLTISSNHPLGITPSGKVNFY